MSSLSQALSQLKEERSTLAIKVEKIDEAIGVLREITIGQKPNAPIMINEHKPGPRFVSASVRRKIAKAQRARWQAIREKKAA